MTIAKALTQPGAPVRRAARGAAARRRAARRTARRAARRAPTLFIFSTTQATNAILEGTTARTAFLCTEGFPDILVRREGGSLRPYDYSRPFPEPYVPRRLTLEISERIDADGNVVDRRSTRAARARSSRARGNWTSRPCRCACSWSTANPAHELALGELIARGAARRARTRSRTRSTRSCASTAAPRAPRSTPR